MGNQGSEELKPEVVGKLINGIKELSTDPSSTGADLTEKDKEILAQIQGVIPEATHGEVQRRNAAAAKSTVDATIDGFLEKNKVKPKSLPNELSQKTAEEEQRLARKARQVINSARADVLDKYGLPDLARGAPKSK